MCCGCRHVVKVVEQLRMQPDGIVKKNGMLYPLAVFLVSRRLGQSSVCELEEL